jgi:hypothetical protein
VRKNLVFKDIFKRCLTLFGIYIHKKHVYNLVRVIIYCLDKTLEEGDFIQLDEIIIKKNKKYISISSPEHCEFPKNLEMTDKRNIEYFNRIFGNYMKEKD